MSLTNSSEFDFDQDLDEHFQLIQTEEINGTDLIYCIGCIRPHITQYCNGNTTTTYEQCHLHHKFSKIAADTMSTTAEFRAFLESRLQMFNNDRYEEIRQSVGLQKMALLLDGSDLHYTLTVLERQAQGILNQRETERLRYSLDDMLKPKKLHAGGCLHSEHPEVILCNKDQKPHAETTSKCKKSGQESKLATSLYFKRCDGAFKNVKAEVLSVGLQVRAVDGKLPSRIQVMDQGAEENRLLREC